MEIFCSCNFCQKNLFMILGVADTDPIVGTPTPPSFIKRGFEFSKFKKRGVQIFPVKGEGLIK